MNDFLSIYPSLTNFQKKIFKYIQWFSKIRRCVYPAVITIAKAVGCGVATVMRATKLFQDLGWILKKQRGYISNTYFINDELISLNLNDQSLFLREKCEVNDSVLRSSSSDSNNIGTLEEQVPIEKKREIPHFLHMKCLPLRDQQRLANKFPDYALLEAIKDMKKYHEWGNKIRDFVGMMWSGAKRYYK